MVLRLWYKTWNTTSYPVSYHHQGESFLVFQNNSINTNCVQQRHQASLPDWILDSWHFPDINILQCRVGEPTWGLSDSKVHWPHMGPVCPMWAPPGLLFGTGMKQNLSCWICFSKYKNTFPFAIISQHWGGVGNLNLSSWMIRIHLSCTVNAVIPGGLVKHGARVSAAILLT